MGDVLTIATDQVEQSALLLRTVVAGQLADSARTISLLAAQAHLDAEAAGTVRRVEAAGDQATQLATMLLGAADRACAADRLMVSSTGLSGPLGTIAEEIWGFLAGDVAQLWNGGDDGFPLGRLAASALRVNRVRAWLQAGGAMDIPVFSNGKVGTLVAAGLQRVPFTAGAARWMRTPGATATFRWLGVAGGAVSTGVGVYDLWQQGNPVDAFEREGAGYVADVASTAFSASTTAFLIAPNPVTGGAVIVTGVVWAGAEVIDHWDDIAGWTSDRLDDLGDAAGHVWDRATPVLAGAAAEVTDWTSDRLDDLGDAAGGLWDAGGSALDGLGNAIGGLFGG